jgi:4-amino-4-deoxy-L-arabinose transferase-like glycosyltransferase
MKLFISVLLLAAFFRFFQLSSTPSGLYWDELDTGYQAYSLLETGKDYFGNAFPAHLQSFADYRSSLYMYLTVPFVKVFGLSPFSVRLPAVIFSLLTLFVLFYLARRFLRLPQNHAWIPPAVWAFAPWTLVQGRIAAESQIMPVFILLGFAFFLKFLQGKKTAALSALFFALSLWTYGTAKLFLPFLLILLFFSYRKQLLPRLTVKVVAKFLLVFLIICLPIVVETFSKNISMRFGELSVFSDPTTSTEVDYRRLESSLGGGSTRTLGMQPSFLEKAVYNKYTFWGTKLLGNYASALSSGFLFQIGDPQLRHNLSLVNTGQFYLVEALAFILGLVSALARKNMFLLGWLVIAPLSAVITRDGGNHGPRLLPLLIPMVFMISEGVSQLLKNKFTRYFYLGAYSVSVFMAVFYFFTTYRVLSAVAFNTGFTEAAAYAREQEGKYDQIVLDGHNESFLMAYLFVTKYDPKVFQKSFPLPSGTIATGVEGYKFGSTYILYPGTRDWSKIKLQGRSLILSASEQPNPQRSFYNPGGSTAVIAIVK